MFYAEIYERLTGRPFYLACTVHPAEIYLTSTPECEEYLRMFFRTQQGNGKEAVYWVDSPIVPQRTLEALKGKVRARGMNALVHHMRALHNEGFYRMFGRIKQPVVGTRNVRLCPSCALALPRSATSCVCDGDIGGARW